MSYLKNDILLLLAAVIVYINSLQCGFVFDDVSAIKENQDLRSSTGWTNLFKNDFWGTPMNQERSHKSYRPLTVATFRLNFMLHELNPVGYHAVNVILHILVSLIFHRLCNNFLNEESSLISTLIFVVHPVHTEAVTGVVGRAELLSSLIFLICIKVYLKLLSKQKFSNEYVPKTILVGLLMSLGTLCKEQCITLFAVLSAYEFILCYQCFLSDLRSHSNEDINSQHIKSRSKRKIKEPCSKKNTNYLNIVTQSLMKIVFSCAACRILILLLFTIGTMCLRIQVMHGQLPHFTEFDNPAAHAAPLIRRLTHLYLIPVNLGLLLCPSFLCADWTLGSLKLISGWTDPRNFLTLVAFLGLFSTGIVGLRKSTPAHQSKTLIMGLSLMVFPFLPASNLFFPVGFVVAERVLYMPSLGFCLLIGLGYQLLCEPSPQVLNLVYSSSKVTQNQRSSKIQRNQRRFFFRLLVSLIVIAFSLKTIRRNIDWKNEYNLFSSALKVNPNNAKMWNNVGHALEAENKFSEALGYFRKAVSVQPNDMGARINVGRTYVSLGMAKEAEEAYLEALEYFPKPKKGKTYFTRVSPKDLMIFINLANLYLNKTPPQLDDAARLLRRAISLRSDFIEAYQNYGSVLIKLGSIDEAQKVYKSALAHQPHNADLNYNLGVVLLDANNKKEGLEYLNKALLYNPSHQPSMFALASTLSESDQLEDRLKAKKVYEHLVEQKYELIKVYFALGMLETDEHNYEEASEYYKEVIRLDPTHRSALFNIALLYRNNLSKIKEATEALNILIQSHPTHVKSYLLMGDIALTEQKNFELAKKYFEEAVALAPDNLQAKHNLCVTLAESGQWKASELCLVEAIQTFPNSPAYLTEHLSIVRSRLKSLDRT